jgi:hypothetical protein
LEQFHFEMLTPALNGANELRLRLHGGKPCYRMPCLEQLQSEIALHAEEIGMCAGTFEDAKFSIGFVHKEPIGFHVQFPAMLPCALQRMILVLRRQWSLRKQKSDGTFQLLHVFPAPFAFFDVTTKLRGIDGRKHLYTQLLEKVFRILGVKHVLAAIRFFHSYPRQLIRLRVSERQAPLMGYSGQRHSAHIGDRQAHRGEHLGSFTFYSRVNPGAYKITGWHGLPPCLPQA